MIIVGALALAILGSWWVLFCITRWFVQPVVP